MNNNAEKYYSALLRGDQTFQGEIPYMLDNLFYEDFGMSYDEVLKKLQSSY